MKKVKALKKGSVLGLVIPAPLERLGQRGQALMEYMILAGALVVVSVGIVKTMGGTVKSKMQQINKALQQVEVPRY